MPRSPTCCTVERAGLALHLRPDGSLYLPHAVDGMPTLVVADVHLGKAEQFHALGLPVPALVRNGVQSANMARLAAALEETQARRLVVLGDLFHGPVVGDTAAGLSSLLASFAAAARRHGLPPHLVLIGGNHDARAQVDVHALAAPTGWRLTALDEHEAWRQGGCAMTHHPRPVPGAAYTLAGHWHPCVTLHGPAHDRLRLPCFWLGAEPLRPLGILPAFGAFTGMHPIEALPGDEVFALAGEAVVPLAPTPTLPR